MRGTSELRPPGGPRGQGTAAVLVATLVFAVLVAVGVAAGLWSAAGNRASTPAPTQLAGYNLVQAVSGPQAVDDVSRLHGTDIEIVDAWIGHYEGGGEVWVAQASSEAKARELVDDMVTDIQDGGSPFRGLARQQFRGMPVYAVEDWRQIHYFYQRGTQVVWVATPPGAEDAFLAAAFREVG